MPITFIATSNKDLKRNTSKFAAITSIKHTIANSKPFVNKYDGVQTQIVQSSPEPSEPAFVSNSGLISAVTTAYNQHLDLVLDPNDIWITILGQFSTYINGEGRAEHLRDRIVDFQGKKELVVKAAGALVTADFGQMSVGMVHQIAENIKDPSLREWFLPGFSTTTTTDNIAAAVSCMSALQAYFDYKFCLCCGIPQVTLTGTPADWRLLRTKIERLAEFDLKDKLMGRWLELLRPICDNFLQSAEGNADVQFWDTICCHLGGGSGPSYLSGWIAAFSVFSHEGRWQASASSGSPWPQIDTADLNNNVVSVPVTIDDNGVEYKSTLFAGQFVHERVGEGGEVVRPRNDWAIAVERKTASPAPAVEQ